MAEQSPEDSVQSRLTASLFGAESAPKATPEAAPEASPEEVAPTPEEADDGNDDLDLEDLGVIRVPKEAKAKISEWKEGALRREDYTQKTQQLADLTRHAQIASETLELRQQFESSVQKERSELASIQSQLEQYKSLNWGELDVNQYIRLKGQVDTLKERAEELKGSLNTKAQEANSKFEENKKRLMDEGKKYLAKALPKMDKDTADNVWQAGLDIGYTHDYLEKNLDPRLFVALHGLAQYRKIQGAKETAVASVQKAPPVVKPGASAPGAAAENKYRDMRAQQRKSGSLADTTRLLMLREK